MNPTTSAQLPDGLREAIANAAQYISGRIPDWNNAGLYPDPAYLGGRIFAAIAPFLTPKPAPAPGSEAREAATPAWLKSDWVKDSPEYHFQCACAAIFRAFYPTQAPWGSKLSQLEIDSLIRPSVEQLVFSALAAKDADLRLARRELDETKHDYASIVASLNQQLDSLASAKQAIAAYSALDELMNKC